MVPERATVPIPSLIVKAAGASYPGLAANEYLCLSAAKKAHIKTPDFELSNDGQLLVLDPFDLIEQEDGRIERLGFEDIAALAGLRVEETLSIANIGELSSRRRAAQTTPTAWREPAPILRAGRLFGDGAQWRRPSEELRAALSLGHRRLASAHVRCRHHDHIRSPDTKADPSSKTRPWPLNYSEVGTKPGPTQPERS